MRVKRKTVIELTDEEAKFLKGLLQNPQGHPYDEDPDDKRLRYRLWGMVGGITDGY